MRFILTLAIVSMAACSEEDAETIQNKSSCLERPSYESRSTPAITEQDLQDGLETKLNAISQFDWINLLSDKLKCMPTRPLLQMAGVFA